MSGDRQPKWDIYEATILLDGYLEILQGEQPKLRIVKRISADLRQMATNRGIKIDEIYRNENGISYQMQSLDSAYKGKKIYVPATRLFEKVVALYRTDTERYFEILAEAKGMVTATQNKKDAFLAWTSSTLTASRSKWVEANVLKMEQFAVASKLISGSIFEITDISTLESILRAAGKNKLFQIKNRKLIANINEDFQSYIEFCSMKHDTEKSYDQSVTRCADILAEQAEIQQEDVFTVDFNNEDSLAFTKPISVSFSGIELSRPFTWKDVYLSVVSALYKKHPDTFSHLSSFQGSKRLEFGAASDAHQMTAPRLISEKLCVETNFSATDIVRRIKTLLTMSGEEYESITITFVKRASAVPQRVSASKLSTPGEAAFYSFLLNTAKLTEKTCYAYTFSVRTAERYAKENGYTSCSLLSGDAAATVATAYELYRDPNFIKYNEQQHKRFTAAINKLLESIGVEHHDKAGASSNTECEQEPTITEVNSKIGTVLKQHYEYGFKYDSIRELMRFRQFAEAMEISLPDDDEDLKASILASGTIIDDKLYCKSDDIPQELQQIVDSIFATGTSVIYYESLFEMEQMWMESHVITSSDMLKEYLQKNLSGYAFSKKFMSNGSRQTEKEAVTDELKRVWGKGPLMTVTELHNRLPYIPLRNIWRVISGNDEFTLSSEGEYHLIDRFRITEKEEKDILDFVEAACAENGFASLSDVPLGDIAEENYELSQLAIYNAIYKKVLAGKYHLNGKILTKEKSELDAVALLKQYIKDKDECTFDEVAEKVVELTGGTNRQYAFQALYDDMVRVGRNRYIANRLVHFNVDEIDAVLSEFITDDFRAIRDVTTFAMFPICGQSWNHYLLESFCYKYSKKFSLHVMNFNDKNAGIIAEKDFNKNYNEMLAIALARTDVDLAPENIGQYLFNAGYMAKSKYAKLGEIAQRASELRKER